MGTLTGTPRELALLCERLPPRVEAGGEEWLPTIKGEKDRSLCTDFQVMPKIYRMVS